MNTGIFKLTEAIPDNITFLILEDMENIKDALIKDLRAMGVKGEILHAPTIAKANELLKEHKIDFFICDWNLPDGEGIHFVKKVRSYPLHKRTPIVMCTTISEVGNILSAVSAGANEYIVKPWDQTELRKKISMTWSKFIQGK